ncbi:MAG: hypothetical protein RLY43_1246 [Bacteroidota bacterium]|jgi:hypothetical protein
MALHINDVKFDGDDKFTIQFNKCSDYWQKSNDESLTEEERNKNFKLWLEERQKLELGLY